MIVDQRSEHGAVALLVVLLLTVLLLVSAFVIDLGAMRADAARGQAVSDMAAAAAIQEYTANAVGAARDACLEAVDYAERNLDRSLTADGGGCDVFPDDQACDHSGSSRVAVYESDPYTVTVTNPVDDDDALMQTSSHPAGGYLTDGTRCERVGVQVQRTRNFLFAAAGGAGDAGRTTRGAVGRAAGGDLESASLIVLRPEGCRVLRTNSDVRIEVLEGPNEEPGIITVDTRNAQGSCSGGQTIFDPGRGDPSIKAADLIFSNALRFDDPDVGDADAEIVPQPVLPGPPITRYLIDHRYNCMGDYPDGPAWSPETWHPGHTLRRDGEDGSCDTDDDHTSPEPYLQLLHDDTVTPADVGDLDGDWGLVTDCDTDQNYGPRHPLAQGDGTKWFIDCDPFTPDGATFTDATHIVVDGQIRLSGGDRLEVGHSSAGEESGTVLVLRSDGLDVSDTLTLERTFVYLAGTDKDDVVDIAGGAPVEWGGLTTSEAGDCELDPPTAACFAPLSLWANRPSGNSDPFRFSGNAEGYVKGTFFTPNGEVRLAGASSGGPKLKFLGAQFFAQVLDGRGNGSVELTPNEDSMVETTDIGRTMIR